MPQHVGRHSHPGNLLQRPAEATDRGHTDGASTARRKEQATRGARSRCPHVQVARQGRSKPWRHEDHTVLATAATLAMPDRDRSLSEVDVPHFQPEYLSSAKTPESHHRDDGHAPVALEGAARPLVVGGCPEHGFEVRSREKPGKRASRPGNGEELRGFRHAGPRSEPLQPGMEHSPVVVDGRVVGAASAKPSEPHFEGTRLLRELSRQESAFEAALSNERGQPTEAVPDSGDSRRRKALRCSRGHERLFERLLEARERREGEGLRDGHDEIKVTSVSRHGLAGRLRPTRARQAGTTAGAGSQKLSAVVAHGQDEVVKWISLAAIRAFASSDSRAGGVSGRSTRMRRALNRRPRSAQ